LRGYRDRGIVEFSDYTDRFAFNKNPLVLDGANRALV
jgi:hypothetical protein